MRDANEHVNISEYHAGKLLMRLGAPQRVDDMSACVPDPCAFWPLPGLFVDLWPVAPQWRMDSWPVARGPAVAGGVRGPWPLGLMPPTFDSVARFDRDDACVSRSLPFQPPQSVLLSLSLTLVVCCRALVYTIRSGEGHI